MLDVMMVSLETDAHVLVLSPSLLLKALANGDSCNGNLIIQAKPST